MQSRDALEERRPTIGDVQCIAIGTPSSTHADLQDTLRVHPASSLTVCTPTVIAVIRNLVFDVVCILLKTKYFNLT